MLRKCLSNTHCFYITLILWCTVFADIKGSTRHVVDCNNAWTMKKWGSVVAPTGSPDTTGPLQPANTAKHNSVKVAPLQVTGLSLKGATDTDGPLGVVLRFLVVDDSPSVCKILKHMLEKRLSQICFEAENGPQALELVRSSLLSSNEPFDAVFLDCLMPIMDGPTIARELRRMGFKGKIVGFGDDSSTAARKFVEAGVTTVLDKPLLAPVVINIVKGSLFKYSSHFPSINIMHSIALNRTQSLR